MLNIILGLLPLYSFVLCYAFFSTANAGRCRCPQRTAFLHAFIAVGTVLVLSTELWSALHMLNRPVVVATWYGVSAFMVLAIVIQRRRRMIPLVSLPALTRFDWAMAGSLAVLFIIEAVIALASPPNTWDSMTYHMSRVMHWIQNGDVAFYPVSGLRQLYLAPGAEMAIMQLVLLTGSDHLVNLVQLFCMVGSVIGVSLVTCELGGARRVQIFAAIFAATIPMTILQSTSTQNDLAESCWTVCFAFFVLRLRHTRSWSNAASAGAALGFCVLTKGTALIFIPAFLFFAVLGALLWKKPPATHLAAGPFEQPIRFKPQRPYVLAMLFTGAIAAGILAPQAYRTYTFSNGPAGVSAWTSFLNPNQVAGNDFRVANEEITGKIFIANIVRNGSMHLGTPSKRINHRLDTCIRSFLGKEIDNPRSTWTGSSFHVRPSLHEDEAGNPLHCFAIVIAFACLFTFKRYRRLWPLPFFAGAIILGFLLFCLLLKWQPFHSRLHLPLFMCAAPIVAVVFRHLFSKSFRSVILALLLLCSLPWLVFNASRPLLGKKSVLTVPRVNQYFVNRPELEEPYRLIAAEVRRLQPRTVGLAFSEDDWEYPWWVLLGERAGNCPKINHVLVENKSCTLRPQLLLPDLIISTRQQVKAVIGNRTYLTTASFHGLSILAPKRPAFPQ